MTTTVVPPSLSNLSTDILFYILSFQSLADTVSFGLVCRTFNEISQERSVWIVALNRERLIRPIACTSHEDLSKLDLDCLKRIVFHTLRLRHNWTRPEPQIKGVIRTVILQTGGRPFDLIFQVPATDLHVFHSRVTGEVMVWDIGIGKQVAPPVYVARRVVDVSPGQEEEGKFSMGLLTSDSDSWSCEGIVVVCLKYGTRGIELSTTFKRVLSSSAQYWAIFMTKEFVGSLACVTLENETDRTAVYIDVLAINLATSRETLVKTDIPSYVFANAHSGTSAVGNDIFILVENHEKSSVFRIPAEYLPHENNTRFLETISNLKCRTNSSEVPWKLLEEGSIYAPEGALSANNFYESPAVSLHAIHHVSAASELGPQLHRIIGMQIRFWGAAPTMPLTLEPKWTIEVEGILQDSPDTAWKLMLLSHSGRKMLLIMNSGPSNIPLRLVLVTVDPESDICLSHHLILPPFIQLAYIYGLSLDDHRGVINLLDTRGYLFSIPYA